MSKHDRSRFEALTGCAHSLEPDTIKECYWDTIPLALRERARLVREAKFPQWYLNLVAWVESREPRVPQEDQNCVDPRRYKE